MVAETILTPNDFIVPLFIDEGTGIRTGIASMPGYFRQSLDGTVREVKELWSLGIKCVLLFVKSKDELKDNTGKRHGIRMGSCSAASGASRKPCRTLWS